MGERAKTKLPKFDGFLSEVLNGILGNPRYMKKTPPLKGLVYGYFWTKNLRFTKLQQQTIQPHEPQKKTSYFPVYWLVNSRDPYIGLL